MPKRNFSLNKKEKDHSTDFNFDDLVSKYKYKPTADVDKILESINRKNNFKNEIPQTNGKDKYSNFKSSNYYEPNFKTPSKLNEKNNYYYEPETGYNLHQNPIENNNIKNNYDEYLIPKNKEINHEDNNNNNNYSNNNFINDYQILSPYKINKEEKHEKLKQGKLKENDKNPLSYSNEYFDHFDKLGAVSKCIEKNLNETSPERIYYKEKFSKNNSNYETPEKEKRSLSRNKENDFEDNLKNASKDRKEKAKGNKKKNFKNQNKDFNGEKNLPSVFLENINSKIDDILKKREILNESLQMNHEKYIEEELAESLKKKGSNKRISFTLALPSETHERDGIMEKLKEIIQNKGEIIVIDNKAIFPIDIEMKVN